ncbi:hypothetical protein BJF78_28620 [Pseudonocardia sp. CNS-139]|nr:hypothetical protein BJF78_28620 [Pseudonocardia sp. CNS-139]
MVVVDGPSRLSRRLLTDRSGVVVIEHSAERDRRPGMSGLRASALAASTAPVVIFLDDGSMPTPEWLTAWRRQATAAGGGAPAWIPDEYGWVGVVGRGGRLAPVPAPPLAAAPPAVETAEPGAPRFPIPVRDVELAGTAGAALPLPAGPASVLVRLNELPVGCIWVESGADPGAALRAAVDDHLAEPLRRLRRPGRRAGAGRHRPGAAARDRARAAARPPPAPPAGPLATVVVCTLGREPGLRDVVRAVLDQTHPAIELVVVDNDPASGQVPVWLAGIDDPRLRVVAQPVRGLSDARNAGLAAASGEIVVFTDDDARPDRHWVAELVRVFDRDREGVVGCVTGLVTAARLDTPWELFFEEYGGFGKGYRPKFWSLRPPPAAVANAGEPGERGPLFPYAGGNYGSGNNMAFRTDRLRALGGFDPALGAGTSVHGGEDLDAFRAVVQAGDTVFYTPTALVRHLHRDSERALRRQMFGYGTGMAAAVTKQLVAGPDAAMAVLRALPAALRVLLAPGSVKNQGKSAEFPLLLTLTELLGYAVGPLRYLAGRRRVRARTRS